MKVLVVDIGGSHVKFVVWRQTGPERFSTDNSASPARLFQQLLSATESWKYDVVSIGFPGPVIHGRPAADPPNLGRGWVDYDYEKQLRKPVKIINDASMQALGSYSRGRMLFLGLGTGLGSTLILDDVIEPLELGELEYGSGRTLAEVLGKSGMQKAGRNRWEKAVHRAIARLARAFKTDYIVIGGGHVKYLRRLPQGTRRGSNHNAFLGGARLWGVEQPCAHPRRHTWIIV